MGLGMAGHPRSVDVMQAAKEIVRSRDDQVRGRGVECSIISNWCMRAWRSHAFESDLFWFFPYS